LKVEPVELLVLLLKGSEKTAALLLPLNGGVLLHEDVHDLLQVNQSEDFGGVLRVFKQELGEINNAILRLPVTL